MKLNLGKGEELPLEPTESRSTQNTNTAAARNPATSPELWAGWPRSPGSRTLKAPQVQKKAAHPSPAHLPKIPVPPSSLLPRTGQTERTRVPDCLDSRPRKNNFQSIQHPRPPSPPCKRSLPKTLLSLLGKITALKGNCRHATSSGFMTKKKRENKTTSRGVGLHSPHADSRLGCKARDCAGPGPVAGRQRGHREN